MANEIKLNLDVDLILAVMHKYLSEALDEESLRIFEEKVHETSMEEAVGAAVMNDALTWLIYEAMGFTSEVEDEDEDEDVADVTTDLGTAMAIFREYDESPEREAGMSFHEWLGKEQREWITRGLEDDDVLLVEDNFAESTPAIMESEPVDDILTDLEPKKEYSTWNVRIDGQAYEYPIDEFVSYSQLVELSKAEDPIVTYTRPKDNEIREMKHGTVIRLYPGTMVEVRSEAASVFLNSSEIDETGDENVSIFINSEIHTYPKGYLLTYEEICHMFGQSELLVAARFQNRGAVKRISPGESIIISEPGMKISATSTNDA